MQPGFGAAAWKSHDWDALHRLHEKGYIENPVSKNKSVGLTEEGRQKSYFSLAEVVELLARYRDWHRPEPGAVPDRGR